MKGLFFVLTHVALKEFLLDCEVRNFTPKTIKGYRNALELLIRYLAEEQNVEQIEDIEPFHIKQFLRNLQKAGRKPSYLNGLHKAMRSWFKYLLNEDYLVQNPIENVGWAREEKLAIKTFTADEVRKMLTVYSGKDYMDMRNRAIVALLFDTGIRCSELCNLMQADVGKQVFRIYGKGRKERYVAKSYYMEKLLIRYSEYRAYYFEYKNVPDNLFLSRTGRPLTVVAVERVVRIAGERAGVRKSIRCSPHTCRHYFSQAQLKNGNDVYSLSRLLGHSNIKTTNRYLQGMEDAEIVKASLKTSPLMNL